MYCTYYITTYSNIGAPYKTTVIWKNTIATAKMQRDFIMFLTYKIKSKSKIPIPSSLDLIRGLENQFYKL